MSNDSICFTRSYFNTPIMKSGLENADEKNSGEILPVFPNPANNILQIKKPLNDRVLKLSITDLIGNELLKQDYEQTEIGDYIKVNVENLPEGIYLLKLYVGHGFAMNKFWFCIKNLMLQ
jgi:hypothetical protein